MLIMVRDSINGIPGTIDLKACCIAFADHTGDQDHELLVLLLLSLTQSIFWLVSDSLMCMYVVCI